MSFPLRWLTIALGCLALLLGFGCKDAATVPSDLSYRTNPAVYVVGTAIVPNVPSVAGGPIKSYVVSPGLPAGLSLDATTGVLSGTPTTAVAARNYVVTATNEKGSCTATLNLTVNAAGLAISAQPLSRTVLVGTTASFSVTASGVGTLSYQWSRSGTQIPGATSASYTTPATLLADSGSTFTVVVSDSAGGSLTSSAATLTVVAALPGLWTTTLGALGTGRAFHTATLLPLGKVLIAGGRLNATYLTSPELYDPATDSFAPTAGDMNSARSAHTATLLPNGKVLIAGGDLFGSSISSAELYDPATDTFTPTGHLNSPRESHTATLLPNGKVLMVGGVNGASYALTAELYDPATGTFTLTGSLTGARATHTATLLSTGKVLVAGGFNGSNLATAELYDPVAETFSTTASMASARAYHTATELGNGVVLLVGGAGAAELYDPGTGLFTPTGSPIAVRDHWHSAVLLASGKVLVAGGVGSGASLLASAELYDPAAGTFSTTGSLANARETHTATVLADGRVLVAGGAGSGFPTDGEVYQ